MIHPVHLARDTISDLFTQALVGYDDKQHGAWLDTLERFTRLIEAEIQTLQMKRADRREYRKAYNLRK